MSDEMAPELAEELAPGANESDSPPETQEAETPADHDEAPKPRGVQKRLDELTANWRAAERREEQLRQLLERQMAQQQPIPQPQPAPQQTAVSAKPVLEDFTSYEEFTEALTDWKSTQVVQSVLQQREAAELAQRAQREQAERAQTWQQRASEASTKFADFQMVALNPELPVSPAMAEVIQAVENGPDVLYHLGKNPAEAARIAALPPSQAAFALGSLAAALQPPAKATPKPVPQPINPLAGGNAAPSTDPDQMSPAQWLEWRRAQLNRK